MTKKKIKEVLASAPLIEAKMSRLEEYLLSLFRMTTRNHILIDPNGEPYMFNNKYVYYPKEAYSDKSLIPFTPFTNIRMVTALMGVYFTVKNAESNGVNEFTSFSISSTQENRTTKSQAVIKMTNHLTGKGVILYSRTFSCDNLAYIDAILGIEKDELYRSILPDIDNYIIFTKENRNEIAKILEEESNNGNTSEQ